MRGIRYSIIDNIIFFILIFIGIYMSHLPIILIIVASILMIRGTYRSLSEEPAAGIWIVADIVLMATFSLLSGNVTGGLIFFFHRDSKLSIRMFFGVITVIVSQILTGKDNLVAFCVLLVILEICLYCILSLLYKMMESAEKRHIEEERRLVISSISELHEKQMNEQLLAQRYVNEKNARLLEREEISRNIHNSVGHSITAAIMTLDAADMLYEVKPDEARDKMNQANERMRGSLASIRRAVRLLDEGDTLLTAKDLKSEIDRLISKFVMDTNIEIHCDDSGLYNEIILEQDYVTFLTGAVGEFLTNGVKHGAADEFVVVLYGDASHVKLKVKDNGNSDYTKENEKDKIRNGYGLKKIISFVERCGGKTFFENDNGFYAMIELPIATGGENDE